MSRWRRKTAFQQHDILALGRRAGGSLCRGSRSDQADEKGRGESIQVGDHNCSDSSAIAGRCGPLGGRGKV